MNLIKRMKDPIYGYINIPANYVKNIVDTVEFQRLRRIVQTSYSPLYASSVHNRFVHSLGVFHLGEIASNAIIDNIKHKGISSIASNSIEEVRDVFQLACLLHDVGHTPFSHTGEKFYLSNFPQNSYADIHKRLCDVVNSEEFANDIPKSDSKAAAPHEIMSAIIGITSFGEYFQTHFRKEFFARCVTGYKYEVSTPEYSVLNCFISLLNSKVIDVDRLDYLIRDAFFTGFDTIIIDYERLLTSLTIVDISNEDHEKTSQYEIAYQKNAISVIENVVYAHDAERKWIQNHPIVLYDIYIVQHIMSKLDKQLSTKNSKLFSIESLGEEGVELAGGLNIRLMCDDDIIFLMKNNNSDTLSKEYFNRKDRRHPLWKSEAEYNAYLLHLIGEGDILSKLEKAFISVEKYVRQNSDSWIINDTLIKKLEDEISTLSSSKDTIDPKTIKTQLNTKKSILTILKVLQSYAQSHNEDCDFIILGASQFYSGFNRPDVSNINIVFQTSKGEKISKFGKIVSLLNGDKKWRENFFYLYHKGNILSDSNKEEIFKALIQAFI